MDKFNSVTAANKFIEALEACLEHIHNCPDCESLLIDLFEEAYRAGAESMRERGVKR